MMRTVRSGICNITPCSESKGEIQSRGFRVKRSLCISRSQGGQTNSLWLGCAFAVFSLSLCTGSAISGGEENASHPYMVVMQEMDEWVPGMPREIHQTAIVSDGTGQRVYLRDHLVIDIQTFRQPAMVPSMQEMESFFQLEDRYTKRKPVKGLIVEGSPKTVKFLFYYKQCIKIIDCDIDSIPISLVIIMNQLGREPSQKEPYNKGDVFIISQPLSSQERKEVFGITKPISLSQRTLEKIPSLYKSLKFPSLLVKSTDEELKEMRGELGVKDPLTKDWVFIQQKYGVAKLCFFERRD
jgi:hypothetical protein